MQISFSTRLDIREVSGSFQYSTDGGSTWPSISSWPVQLINTNPAENGQVFINNDLTFTADNQYFKIGSHNITILAFYPNAITITINNVANYPGLIQNGTTGPTPGYNNITVQYMNVVSSGTTNLINGGGWIGQEYMNYNASGCSINYCSSTGAISAMGGGILGLVSSGTVINCYSSGSIGIYGGGIFGQYANIGIAINCYSSGDISANESGGIFGSGPFQCNAITCYSVGNIGLQSGGIIGSYSFENNVSNCYSVGSIGPQAGGIFGYSSTKSTAINCYSLGAIGTDAGGIIGYLSNLSTVQNCYTIGAITTTGTGLFGTAPIKATTLNSLATLGAPWDDLQAATYLTGAPTYTGVGQCTAQGSTWIDIDILITTTPWRLGSFNEQLYSPNSSYTTNFSGTTGTGIITNNSDYLLISTDNGFNPFNSINTVNGSISYDTFGSYLPYTFLVMRQLIVSSSTVNYGYQINSYTLNVVPVIPCYNKGTRVLSLKNETKEYINIEKLEPGDLIKTYNHGYKAIEHIGKLHIMNNPNKPAECMYQYKDLIVTGLHSVLVDEMPEGYQKRIWKTKRKPMIDDKYLHYAYQNKHFQQITDRKPFTIYHLVLEGNRQYGIYVNDGILSESISLEEFNKLKFNRSC